MSARWFTGDAMAFDLETTEPDPLTARIVTATIVVISPTGVTRSRDWLVNPGVPIPPEATVIHGVTNEQAAGGEAPDQAVPTIATELLSAWAIGLPVIIMNASYDLTVMGEEMVRVGHDRLNVGPVLDPFVIDRGTDPYRKGKRTLSAIAAHYGVRQSGAHSSSGDALTAARVVWAQANRCWALEKHTLADMQDWQRDSHAARQANYEEYLMKQGTPQIINRDWPVRRAAA